MSNINYGFETIEHRYRVLTDKFPPKINDSKRYNLSSLISGIYGSNYVDDPKMPKLMGLNRGKHRDFLNEKEEVEEFEKKEYLKLHKSTMCKVYFFQSMFYKLTNKKIKTQHSNILAKLNRMVESLPTKILGLIAVLFTVFQIGMMSYQSYTETSSDETQKTKPKISSNNRGQNTDSTNYASNELIIHFQFLIKST